MLKGIGALTAVVLAFAATPAAAEDFTYIKCSYSDPQVSDQVIRIAANSFAMFNTLGGWNDLCSKPFSCTVTSHNLMWVLHGVEHPVVNSIDRVSGDFVAGAGGQTITGHCERTENPELAKPKF